MNILNAWTRVHLKLAVASPHQVFDSRKVLLVKLGMLSEFRPEHSQFRDFVTDRMACSGTPYVVQEIVLVLCGLFANLTKALAIEREDRSLQAGEGHRTPFSPGEWTVVGWHWPLK